MFEDDAALAEGTIVAGRYRVLEPLGSGAMGTVYLAEHLAIGRRVALKVLAAGWARTADVTRRFRAEARAASSVGHPNIVEVLDADELPDGRPFLVMELLEGRDLLSFLRAQGRVPWSRVCQIAASIARALAAAHAIGIIHRDLKAENVMLVDGPAGDIVKVLDFGIAVNISDGAERATRPGVAVGTPEYMAPEQARGDRPAPSFDIYATGVLMFELLSGDPPFTAANPLEILGRKTVSPAPSIATRVDDLPPELVEVVDSCLAIEPQDRPATANALAERLEAILQGSKEVARVVAVSDVAPVRRGVEPWAVALVSALVLGTAVFVAWPSDEPEPVVAAHPIETPAVAVPPPEPREPLPEVATANVPEPEPPIVPAPTPAAVDPPAEPTTVRTGPKPKRKSLPDVAPDAKPPATADAPPSTDAERCAGLRRDAEEARQAHEWRSVLRHTEKAECWPSGGDRNKLRVKANMELSRFSECVRLGEGNQDVEVVKWVQLCRKRLGAGG